MSKKKRDQSDAGKSQPGSKPSQATPGKVAGKAGKEVTETDELLRSTDSRSLLEFEGGPRGRASIKVIGVGGGGGNAVNTMIDSGLTGVEFMAANTDSQALQYNLAAMKLQLGNEATRGLGCGADPTKGQLSATEVRERIAELLQDTDMVFVTAGLGGGTGTGAAPVIAEVARELGALTVAVVTKPFMFEGRMRMKHAEAGLDELHRVVDTVITIPNQRLLALAGKKTSMRDAFRLADEVLFNAVRGISDLITIHGLINLDFADVRTIMNEMGAALMGTGTSSGEARAVEAARAAISSPLLEDLSIDGAHGVLINITGGEDLSLFDVNEASTLIQEAAHEDANIIFGAVIDDEMEEGTMRVTVIATGLDDKRVRRSPNLDVPAGPPANVRPLRPEPVRSPSPEVNLTPAAVHETLVQSEFRDIETQRRVQPPEAPPEINPEIKPRAQPEAPTASQPSEPETIRDLGTGEEFVSPFDDELDIPTFLRRSAD
jgi:cell division protein FtsZ